MIVRCNGNSSSDQVEVGPGDPECFAESQTRREHEACQLGQIVMLRYRIGIEYAKPLADLLQGERASGPVTIEFQRGEVTDGVAWQGTTPDEPAAHPRQD
jgi:hypothetical protein